MSKILAKLQNFTNDELSTVLDAIEARQQFGTYDGNEDIDGIPFSDWHQMVVSEFESRGLRHNIARRDLIRSIHEDVESSFDMPPAGFGEDR